MQTHGFTYLEQRQIYAELEPAWNGTMERAGTTAIRLSSYRGRSSIYHSPSYVKPDPVVDHLPVLRPKRHGGKRTKCSPELEAAALDLLRKGVSYRLIGRKLGISETIPRRIGRQHGIDRRGFAGSNQYRTVPA